MHGRRLDWSLRPFSCANAGVARQGIRQSHPAGYTGRDDSVIRARRTRRSEWRSNVDILVELIKAVVTVGIIAFIAVAMAGLFIIVLSLATGIDSAIQPDEDAPR